MYSPHSIDVRQASIHCIRRRVYDAEDDMHGRGSVRVAKQIHHRHGDIRKKSALQHDMAVEARNLHL